jgi:hypothetical protein
MARHLLDTFEMRAEKKKTKILIYPPRVFMEVKEKGKPDDPIQQPLDSIKLNESAIFSSKGYLIGIKGSQWTIMDFQLVISDVAQNPQCLYHNF